MKFCRISWHYQWEVSAKRKKHDGEFGTLKSRNVWTAALWNVTANQHWQIKVLPSNRDSSAEVRQNEIAVAPISILSWI